MEALLEQKILKRLDLLHQEVKEIKEHMIDVDTILSSEERRLLDESIQHEREGKLVTLEEIDHARQRT